MKFCNKCGNKLSNAIKFCNKCGAKIAPINNVFEEKKSPQECTHNESMDNYPEIDISTLPNVDIDTYNTPSIETVQIVPPIQQKTKSKKFSYILSSCILLIVIVISIILYFSKDSLFYNYHFKKASEATSVIEQITNYNTALEYKYNPDITMLLFDILKQDSYFLDEISKITNLHEDDKNILINKLCIFKADENFNNENYDACLKYLKIAKEHGFTENDYVNYDSLMKKINETTENKAVSSSDNIFTFNNENPSSPDGNIFDYLEDYIMPSSNSRYLSYSDISHYNKDTLALIRNEIFARHGYVFQTEPFKSYFNSKYWYMPDSSFKGSDSELNKYEIKNIQTILDVENSK